MLAHLCTYRLLSPTWTAPFHFHRKYNSHFLNAEFDLLFCLLIKIFLEEEEQVLFTNHWYVPSLPLLVMNSCHTVHSIQRTTLEEAPFWKPKLSYQQRIRGILGYFESLQSLLVLLTVRNASLITSAKTSFVIDNIPREQRLWILRSRFSYIS